MRKESNLVYQEWLTAGGIKQDRKRERERERDEFDIYLSITLTEA